MTLFCVRDGDSSGNVWNKPLKKVEQTTPAKPEYVPTATPGIVQNTKTGKLETNFPELEDSRGSQIPLIPLQETPEFQRELENRRKLMREAMELSAQMMDIPAAMQVARANTPPPRSLSSRIFAKYLADQLTAKTVKIEDDWEEYFSGPSPFKQK